MIVSRPSITTSGHKTLRQLIHFISEGPAGGFVTGAYRETLPAAGPFPLNVTWYTDSGKTQKIVEKIITRNIQQIPTQIHWKMYGTDGITVVEEAIDIIAYSGVFETSRTRTII